jgi:hypothetical protein
MKNFALRVTRLCARLPTQNSPRCLGNPLVRSGASSVSPKGGLLILPAAENSENHVPEKVGSAGASPSTFGKEALFRLEGEAPAEP